MVLFFFSLSSSVRSQFDKFIAIHMAFDCMAIGVGLFASVMATWDPNERFTYGYLLKKSFSQLNARLLTVCFSYGRIETLSGFANGIFLILISIFIIFEAIQRMCVPFSVSDFLSYKSHLFFW